MIKSQLIEIGKRIKLLRKDQKLTLDAFGHKIRRDYSTVSKLESGTLELSKMIKLAICNVFAVREEWLLEGKEPMYDDRWVLLEERAKELGEEIYIRLRSLLHKETQYNILLAGDKNSISSPYGEEIQSVINAVIEVMTSDDEGTKLALAQNAFTFQRTVRNGKEIAQLKSDIEAIKRRLMPNEQPREDDFKNTGIKRENH